MPKRRIALALAGMTAVTGAVWAVTAVAPAGEAGDRLISSLREASGLALKVNGKPEVSLFPSPRVRVDGVSLGTGSDTPFAVARELAGSIRLAPLLLGRVELGEITLVEPQIALDRIPAGAMASTLRSRAAAGRPAAIRVVDGRLAWNGRTVERVEAGLVWPQDGGPLTMSGFGRYEGRRVEATFRLADLAAFARAERSPFRARVEGGGVRVSFDGEAADPGAPRLTGEISARATSISDTLAWLGGRAARDQGSRWNASFAGRATLDAGGLQISNGELDLAGESFLGAGRLTAVAGRPAMEATLDAGSLDLGPYAATLAPALLDADGRWSDSPIDLDGLAGWSLDLRLSAKKLTLGRFGLGETAATLAVADGGLDLSIGEAEAYGGTIGGRLALEPKGEAVAMRLEGGATAVAIEEALGPLLSEPPIAGALTADLSVEGAGRSVADLMAGLGGRASAHLVDGALESVGKSRTLALAGLRGRISVSRADVRMAIARGVAQADDISIAGPDASFALSGGASFMDRSLRLTGAVTPAAGGWTLPVVVEGPLSAPRLRPDFSRRGPRGEASRGSGGAERVR
jgi:AsmA protein